LTQVIKIKITESFFNFNISITFHPNNNLHIVTIKIYSNSF